MTLFYMVAAWSIGISLASSVHNTGSSWPWWIAAGVVLILLMRSEIRARRVGLCLIACGLGIWRFESVQPHFTEADLFIYNDHGPAEMIGVVIDDPEVHDNAIRLRVEMQSIQQGGQPEKAIHGLALVNADRSGNYAYGDRIRIRAEPVTPPVFDEFSYRDYLARSGVYTFILRPQIKVLGHGLGSPVWAAMFDIRKRSHQLINRLLPSPQSALLTGILLGVDSDLPPDVSDAFNQTGTTHIIAISGSNITIIAGLLMAVFGRLADKRLAAILMIMSIGVYTVFVGASPSVVRAAMMGSLAIMAQRLGRPGDGLTALGASVWVMTALNPMALFDLGLILSSAATLGLILYTDILTRRIESIMVRLFAADTARHVMRFFADAVLMTIAAQITTLPIIFLAFGRFSALSFVVNMLIIPVQAWIMSLGILALVAGAIWLPIGQLIVWLVGIPLTYTLAIVRAAAQLPGVSVPITVEPIHILVYYAALFGLTAVLSRPLEERRALVARLRQAATTPAVGLMGAATAALLWAMVLSRPDGKLHIWFLAVGEGNAVLIQTPRGAHLLIDGGENPTRLRTALGDRLPFFKRDLDMLFITQPRPKTITALPALFERYTVQTVITNGQRTNDNAYRALTAAFEKLRVRVIAVTAGYRVQTDEGVIIDVLHPQQPPDSKAKWDDVPLILRLTYHDATFLFTPEVSEKGIQALIPTGHYWGARVLQLPSNGADKANPDSWLQAVSPQIVIILAEPGSRAAQPAESVLKRLKDKGIPVYRTDLQGTIEIATDGQQLWISTTKPAT